VKVNTTLGMDQDGAATRGEEYAQRLIRLQMASWKRWLNVQAPFRWNLRRLDPGVTLDVGCGIGRNLVHLPAQSVGVDTNEHCVIAARARGLTAFTPAEFANSAEYNRAGRFDTILLAHVAEHMTETQVVSLLEQYERLVRPDGKLILITPQEAGFKSDATHVQLMDFGRLTRISERLGFRRERAFSFPFPRWAGRLFTYNEFVVVSRKPAAAPSIATNA
jgi:2-polyprenyl-3-methyl-5-hydroxy-6-metoxy-1,4-benzoquinol methylase